MIIVGVCKPWGRRRSMSEQATEPGVIEGGHLQKSLKTQRMTMVSLGDVIEAGLFVGGWQFRSHRRRVVGNAEPKQSASFSPVLPNPLGEWR
jgi:hypothetical protein